MAKNGSSYDKYLLSSVKGKFLSNIPIEEIAKEEGLFRNEILAILREANVSSKMIRPFLSDIDIESPSFVLLADTHYGSIYENPDYIKIVYEFCARNSLEELIHLGDFLHGQIDLVNFNYKNIKKQIAHALAIYPFDKNIRNHILFGNHDLNAFLSYKKGIDELASREDFHLLGFKNAYLMWNHCLFKLSHEINKYYLRLPEAPYDLALFGHSHMLKFAKNGIYVPALCDHNLNEIDNFMPGILVGKRIDNILYIVFYSIEELKNSFLSDDKIIEKSKTKSLKLDLNTKKIA